MRRKLLREMAQVMIEDDPDLVLLQEVPVWAADLLREHTGMGVTLAPTYGAHIPFVHVPLPLALGAAVGRALPDLVRTQIEGQAQAILYGPGAAAGLGPPRAAERAHPPARRAAHRPARPAAASPRRPRARGRQRPRRPGRRRAAREGRVRARALRPRGADGAGRRPERRRRSRRACARCARAGWIEDSGDVGIDHLLVRGFDVEWAATRWLARAARPAPQWLPPGAPLRS